MKPSTKMTPKELRHWLIRIAGGGTLLVLLITVGTWVTLPDIESLRDVHLQVPLRVYTRDRILIAEFGQMKRTPLHYNEFPPQLVHAILAAEDARFFEHPGVDLQGLLRAVYYLAKTGERAQGGSTITMQVARNFFLSREKTFLRKFNEILLALKIEAELSKEDILELYMNKIYLGKRAYGFGAASQIYYGKNINELSLAQLAMISGLPKAPSAYNPVANPQRALLRRNYILSRMLELKYITDAEFQTATAERDNAAVHSVDSELDAPYVAEMVRSEMLEKFGNDIYTEGYQVVTTVDSKEQRAANEALRNALFEYDRRHGYRGILNHVDLLSHVEQDEEGEILEGRDAWISLLSKLSHPADMLPAIVLSVDDNDAYAYTSAGNIAYLPWSQINWARRYISDQAMGAEPQNAHQILHEGDIIYITPGSEGCSWLAQLPQVAGALISLNPEDGAIRALIGGYDFYESKFNRVTQAKRQPGSSFKPFIYSAAIDKGFTAASIINDAPVVFDAPGLEDTWRPENYSGQFYGPTRLREALINSRNLVSIRLLRSIGIGYALRYARRFGLENANLPRDLSLALGSGTLTPLELARGYSVFANKGYLIQPYLIDTVTGPDEKLVDVASPVRICHSCAEAAEAAEQKKLLSSHDLERQANDDAARIDPETGESLGDTSNATHVETAPTPVHSTEKPPVPAILLKLPDAPTLMLPPILPRDEFGPHQVHYAERIISPQTDFLMTSMMRDVIRFGTGRRALVLGRNDLAGKTGTTNDQRDAWFAGFNPEVVTVSWVGFDTPRPLGASETGAHAALPMWIDFMREALRGKPEIPLAQPPGMVSVRIDAATGKPTTASNADAVFEFFLADQAPSDKPEAKPSDERGTPTTGGDITQQIF